MTTPPPDDTRPLWRRRLRRAAPLLALAVALVIVAVLVTPAHDSGLPLDPNSTGPDGTRALTEVLETLDRPVAVVDPDHLERVDQKAFPAGTNAVFLVLHDQLNDTARANLLRRVAAGARLVVTDPASPLTPPVLGTMWPLEPSTRPRCNVDALTRVGPVDIASEALYEVPDDGTGCFVSGDDGDDTTDDLAWLVAQPRGRGEIISTGGAQFLTNGALGEADNAVLAVHLLAPGTTGGTTVVRPVVGVAGDDGTRTLGDLIPAGVRAGFWQVLIGFLVLVVWRARRLGMPLEDRAPVRLASSDLTAAVAALFGRNDSRAATAQRIADQTRRRLAQRLDLPATVDTDALAEHVATRTSYDAATVARTLSPSDPRTDAALLAAATACSDLEHAVSTRLAPTSDDAASTRLTPPVDDGVSARLAPTPEDADVR